MSMSNAIVWEIRQSASDLNGGGFKAGATGTDYSQQVAAQLAIDNSAIVCTTPGVNSNTLTFVSGYTPTSADVGNVVHLTAGTNVNPGPYEITGFTSTTWTLAGQTFISGAGGPGSAIVGRMGGAKATPGCLSVLNQAAGGVGTAIIGGHRAWVKYSATDYLLTTATAGPGGPCSLPGVLVAVEGYDVTRGDRTANVPIVKWAVAPGSLTYAMTAPGGAKQTFMNLVVTGDSTQNSGAGYANTGGFSLTSRCTALDCTARNMAGTGQVGFLVADKVVRCKATNCTTGFLGSGSNGTAHKCSATGVTTGFSTLVAMSRCIAYSVPTGFTSSSGFCIYSNCTADGCTTTGFSNGDAAVYDSCLATNCTIGATTGTNTATMHNCAFYNNTTNVSGSPLAAEGAVSLSGDPYTNRAAQDFRPNNSAGASMWAAGMGVAGQATQADIGAIQHADPTFTGSLNASRIFTGM